VCPAAPRVSMTHSGLDAIVWTLKAQPQLHELRDVLPRPLTKLRSAKLARLSRAEAACVESDLGANAQFDTCAPRSLYRVEGHGSASRRGQRAVSDLRPWALGLRSGGHGQCRAVMHSNSRAEHGSKHGIAHIRMLARR